MSGLVRTSECVMKLCLSSRWKSYPGNCRSTPVAIAAAARATDPLMPARKDFASGKLPPESIRNLQRKLYRKAKNDVVQGRGTRQFSDEVLYKQYGLVRLMDVLARR